MKALIVIDMLHDFMDESGALFCGQHSREIIPVITDLLAQHRALDSLIVFVQDNHSEHDKEFERFPPHCVNGTVGSQLIPEIEVCPGEWVVTKQGFGACFRTNLVDILQRHQVDEVQLCGVCTSICIMETCSELCARDYNVLVHKKAVADFDLQAHQFALARMQNILGAKLV